METSTTEEQLDGHSVFRDNYLTDKTAMRLLDLYPGHYGQPLRGALRRTHLSEAEMQYSVLSYTREDHSNSHSITIGDQIFHINSNLHQFLTGIRRIDESLTLWVDTICIDQTSSREKVQQVHLMGCILSHAKETLVWLGEEPDDMKAFYAIAQNMKHTPHLLDPDFVRVAERSQGLYGDLAIEVIDEACLHFLGKRYWTQAQVAPELFSTPSNLICCGNEMLPWKLFSTSIGNRLGLVSHHKWPKEMAYYLENFLRQLFYTLPTKWYANDFISLIQISYSNSCNVPRDRVFALLSLIDKEDDPLFVDARQQNILNDQVSTTAEQIIDYDIPLEALFWQILQLYEDDGLVRLHFAISLFRALELDSCDFSNSTLDSPERVLFVEFRSDLVEKSSPRQDLHYHLNGYLQTRLQSGGHPHPGSNPQLLDRVWLFPNTDEPRKIEKLCLGGMRRPVLYSAAVYRASRPIFEANIELNDVWEYEGRQAYLGRLKLSLRLIQALSRLDRMLEPYRAEGYGRSIRMFYLDQKGGCGSRNDTGLPGQSSQPPPKSSG